MLRNARVRGLLVGLICLLPVHRLQAQTVADERAAVETLLRVPASGTMVDIARTRGTAVKALTFDALPIVLEFVTRDDLGSDAAYAMLGADQTRALRMLFESIPQSGPNVQRIAFTWFLDRYLEFDGPTSALARTAALRTLDPVRSTANGEAALYILGLTGSAADSSVLEFHAVNVRTGSRGMRDASHAALLRVGSRPHLDRLREQLARPLPQGATFQQRTDVALALQKAGFSGRQELVPSVCTHLADAPAGGLEFRVDTGRSARLALNAIVDHVSVTHLSNGTRSPEEWASYCAAVLPASVP